MVQDTDISQEIALFTSTVTTQPDGEEVFLFSDFLVDHQVPNFSGD